MSQKMGLIGRKLGMTRYFHDDGSSLGCTVLEIGPCVVTGQLTPDKHGYTALQIGFEEQATRKITRAKSGYFKKVGIEKIPAVVREIRLDDVKQMADRKVGDVITASQVFKAGDVVDVVGISKGKGYQGVMKRHQMGGDSATHGTHEFFRHGGSIGCRLTPQRVHKGKRMAGQMGNEKVTQQNLQLFRILADDNVILVRGSVPGSTNEYVVITKAATRKQYKRKGMGKEEVRSKNPLKASKKAAAGRG